MAKLRVHEWLGEDHAEAGMDWEQEAYRAGCAYARELGERRLQTLDDELMRNRPKGLRLVGSRVRTVVTRFGDVTVGRRLYRDTDGETVFLLDEYLGWKPQQQASPSITESIVGMAAQMPFRVVTEVVSALTAGVLSKSSVHRMVQGVGQDVSFPGVYVYGREGEQVAEHDGVHLDYLTWTASDRDGSPPPVLLPLGAYDILLPENLVDLRNGQTHPVLPLQKVGDLLSAAPCLALSDGPHPALHSWVYLPLRSWTLLRLLVAVEEGKQPFAFNPAYPQVDRLAVFPQALGDVCFRDSLLVELPSHRDHRDVQHVHERIHGLSDFYGNIAVS